MKQAIYREFRPKDFTRVVGQEHIVEILKNQIRTGNLGHAYLFSGIRGTGKTSCAKIFARAVNCLSPIDGNPCNECENCKMILEDKALEVVEMDAASNRRIDDIRELKEKVIYPPQIVKYKVYIIDEAHMITNEGFNALLKILEDPPKHLIFILATTEIDKLPDTIISRCQRFEFKRIGNSDIVENINYVLNNLNVKIEEDGINLISELSSGAMRDALSLLDQVVATGKEKITIEDINECLGLVNLNMLFELSKSILNSSKNETIETFRNLVKNGKTPHNIIIDLIKHFRNIILVKSIKKELTTLNDVEYKRYLEHSNKFEMDELIFILENLLDVEDKMKKSDMQNALAELLIIKICSFKKEKSEIEKRLETLETIIKSGNLQVDLVEKEDISNEIEKNIEIVENTETIEDIESTESEENTEDNNTEDITNEVNTKNVEQPTEEKNEIHEKIELTSFKDVLKETIFKKTISKLFDESVKEIYYFPKENFLHIDCKEYLFKFGSYKLDKNNCFVLKENDVLNDFFTRVNMPVQNSLTIYANFIG
ncbi:MULTISPECIES: DNA polymerase III subunit gamma/tau [unclassified Parvimonas]|uniref:DNA polymerase III subunit gamma/tau n=1 Tax=unclassified Parvimonas TaxID=1151464 RepID=UPI002B481C5B|nr:MULTISPECIES: DNA polymerase III subunit gamma/tau [unclassified Parvimonas]MEB3024862.1 DNA polymerase III subunit gamma/tau [Parvimonas sp. M13]MEB3088991.1 DNA polymerase III subunit gamma/tau [Parvimonas sp. M20]